MPRQKGIDFKEAQKKGAIITGFVRMAREGVENKELLHLVLIADNKKVIVPAEEVVPLPYENRISAYVGLEMEFIVTEIAEDGTIYGSNKKAMEKKTKPIYDALYNGEVIEGVITNILNYGAYISLGGVPVLMKNMDFSDDGTAISEKYKELSTIRVKYHKTSSNGTIIVKPEKRHRGFKSVKYEDFTVGMVCLGKVMKLSSDRAYVNIAPSLDALCSVPKFSCSFQEGDIVRITIIKKFDDTKRVRGKIINTVSC